MSAGHDAVMMGWLVALASCGGAGGRDEAEWVTPNPAAEAGGADVHITGIVRHEVLEGGFYAIRGDDSVTYDPTNLPPEFQQEGLRIEADARRQDDVSGIHMVGPIVDIVRIRAR